MIGHGFLVGPFKQINELGPVLLFGFPGGNDLEIVFCHDPHGVISKPVMKRFFIAIKYFVDPQLMNHLLWFARIHQPPLRNEGAESEHHHEGD